MRFLVATMGLLLSTALTSGTELKIVFGGQFYDGAPEYQVIADNEVVLQSLVATETGDAVSVDIGDATSVAIRFVNDIAAPKDESGRRPPDSDRNLILESFEFEGVTMKGVELLGTRGVQGIGDFALISNNVTVPLPLPKAVEPVPEQHADVDCEPREIQISQFGNGDLLPNETELDQLANLGSSAACSLKIIGYSSTSGPASANRNIAQQRAEAISKYIDSLGMIFKFKEITAFGETEQFGLSQAENRRVVVELR